MSFEAVLNDKRRILASYQKMTDQGAVLAIAAAAPAGTLSEFHAGTVRVGLRHDMDSDVENAVRMAEWEHAHGLRSTYFALHTDWYYRHGGEFTPLLLASLERIASLGHEIGLHNNAMSAARSIGLDAQRVLRYELAMLRAHFDVRGTAAHGDAYNHECGAISFELFDECVREGNADRVTHAPLSFFDLDYEAYHLGYDEYLSDNGGKWNDDPARVCAAVLEGRSCVVLQHPLHWRVP